MMRCIIIINISSPLSLCQSTQKQRQRFLPLLLRDAPRPPTHVTHRRSLGSAFFRVQIILRWCHQRKVTSFVNAATGAVGCGYYSCSNRTSDDCASAYGRARSHASARAA